MKTKATQLLLLVVAVSMAVMGHPDTAQAQNTVAFSPNPVLLTSSVNNQSVQSTTVTVTVNGVPATSVSGVGNTGFFSATPGSGPGSLTVIANPQGLQAGTYNGLIAVTANGNISASLPVTLTIYNANTITVDQTSLTFSAGPSGAPPSQTVNVNSNAAGLPVTVAAATTTGGNWLTAALTAQAVPTQVIVSVNPAGLAAGTYNGSVTVSSGQSQPQVISVTLTVTGQPLLVVNPNPVNLVYQTGVNAPAPTATLQVLTTGSPVFYSGVVNYTTPACGNWFTVTSGLSGTANSQLTLAVNLTAVGATTQCTGNIVISAPGTSNSSVTVNVNLQSSQFPLLNVTPTFASFSYSIGGAVPPAQAFSVSSSGTTPLNYSVSSQNNFLMTPAVPQNGFTTPSTFSLALNPTAVATLNPGSYTGSVTVSALGSGTLPVTIPVTLTVSNNPLVTVSQSFVNFNYQTGTSVPSGIPIELTSTMGSLPFTVSVPTSTSATQFVAAFPLSGTATPTATPVTINLVPSVVSGLAPGNYQNQVQIIGGSGTQLITVNLTVSNSPLVNLTPQQLTFNYATNGPQPPSQSLAVSSTNGSNLPVSLVSNQSGILVTSNLTTPGTANVSVVTTGLTPGTYTGQITVTSGAQTQIVPVTVNVTSGVSLSVTPTTLAFTQAANSTAPAAQTVTVAATGGANQAFSVGTSTVTGGGWLLVNGSNPTTTGTAPGTFTVTANGAGLAAGVYNGAVTITSVGSSNPSITIPVSLTITAPALAAAPASLSFNAAVQSAAPPSQTINVTSTGSANAAFTAAAQSTGGNWLSVTPATGTTPQAVTVSVNQTGLVAGNYTGTISLSIAGGTPLIVPVTLTVGAQSTPVVSRAINAASGASGPIAPGEIISLFGTNMGPVTPGLLNVTPQGNVATSLSNVQVLFDGIPAPLTYVSATQINAVVPYEIFGRATTNVVVNFNGLNAAALQLNVAATAPGIFTLNSAGSGPAAVLNQNNSVNGASNTAAKGSTIVLYATGEGQTNPAGVTGSVTGATLKNPQGAVSVTIGGVPATVSYAGSAPTFVSGLLQVNVVIPAGAPSGAAVPVVVTIGGVASQGNATIAIQ